MKNRTRVQDLLLFEFFGLKLSKTSFQATDPNFYRFEIKNLFLVSLHNILHKASPYFQYFNNVCKKKQSHLRHWSTKIQMSPKPVGQI